ncbi:MAG: decaprenyl-phosphate phosphoribosyltransferase [Armatimonadetes bacterium]|nr:decaprenyl-phosphate phosphoribosyltransferase [Armatimonadota bacterium]
MIKDFIKTARPSHYSKNIFVFSALIFAQKFLKFENVILTFWVFFSFCLAASAVYFLNDIFDKKEDSLHLSKKHRPIAAGRITGNQAIIAYLFLIIASCLVSLILVNKYVFIIILVYLVLNIFYSWKLKHVVLIDIFIVSIGFVLRVLSGGLAIGVNISEWLLICAILLALFLAIAKRREEYMAYEMDKNNLTRKVITNYNETLLNQMIGIVASLTIISYSLYTILNENFNHLIFTVPFVLYGIFRYLYIIFKEKGGAKPEKEMLRDKHILFTSILWFVAVIVIIAFFQ